MFAKHCSDEELLAHLDGELSPQAEGSVERHLKACWRCRTRLAEVEEQIHALAKALDHESFPGPEWIIDAKTTFSEWADQFDQNFGKAQASSRLPPKVFTMKAVAITVSVLILLGALGIWSHLTPSAAEILARTEKLESTFYRSPSYQVFRVELAQIKPVERRRTSRLEVWSEQSGRRFASRWSDRHGMLRHALWRPEPGREYAYDSVVAASVVKRVQSAPRVISLADLWEYGLDLERLEIGFMRWLEGRRWRPVSFASDLSLFASQEGVTLRAERTRSEEGKQVLRLSAQRRTGQLTAELVIEVDANTYRPHLRRIYFETPEGAFKLSLIAERIEVIEPAALVSTVFEPDLPLAKPERRLIVDPPPAVTPEDAQPLVAGDLAPLAPSPAALAGQEIAVRYALHRIRACLGEPIEFVRKPDGSLVVHGIASTLARKAQFFTALAELGAPSWLRLDIQTMEEAKRRAQPPEQPGQKPAEEETSAETVPAKTYSMEVSSDRLPIQDELEAYFKRQPIPRTTPGTSGGQHGEARAADTARMIGDFAREVVSQSEATLAEAWALRRLAGKYGAGRMEELLPQSRWLLETMVREHLDALQGQAARTRTLLEPVLSNVIRGVAGGADVREGDPASGPVLRRHGAAETWSAGVLRIFQNAEQIHGRVLALFAGADLPLDLGPGGTTHTRVSAKSPGRVVSELLQALPELQTGVQQVRGTTLWEVSGSPKVASTKPSSR